MRLMIAAIFCALATPSAAQTEAETFGRRIAEKAAEATAGWRDLEVSVTMTLRDRGGTTGSRAFRMVTANSAGGGRTLIIVDAPADIRNTALLTHSYRDRRDDQWLYLPALGKTRKINAAGRAGKFVGSEFTYQDMVDQSPDDYRFVWLGDGPCPDTPETCHVLDRFPKSGSKSARQRLWLTQKTLKLLAVEYYGRGTAPLKTLSIRGYQQYSNGIWRASEMEMVNHQTQRATLLGWADYRFDTGVDPRLLTPEALSQLD
ncbi:MAG: outer membrane lipoprotein-sorting protein [Rhodobacteraceae bacterium]|nr:outer membrane lipoprotein-sorting protein [Paracoccaceae bacterium]